MSGHEDFLASSQDSGTRCAVSRHLLRSDLRHAEVNHPALSQARPPLPSMNIFDDTCEVPGTVYE